MPRRTPGTPTTALASRVYWTRERVIAGLQRMARDFGQTPCNTHDYHALVKGHGRPGRGMGNPYPSFYAVLTYWRTTAAAVLRSRRRS